MLVAPAKRRLLLFPEGTGYACVQAALMQRRISLMLKSCSDLDLHKGSDSRTTETSGYVRVLYPSEAQGPHRTAGNVSSAPEGVYISLARRRTLRKTLMVGHTSPSRFLSAKPILLVNKAFQGWSLRREDIPAWQPFRRADQSTSA